MKIHDLKSLNSVRQFFKVNTGSHKESASESPEKQKYNRLRLLLFGAAVCLVISLGVYSFWTLPSEQNHFKTEAKILAGEIDGMVKQKTSMLSLIAGRMDLDTVLKPEKLDVFYNKLKDSMSDFLSIEIISDRGQILGMTGDLSLADAEVDGVGKSNYIRVGSDIPLDMGLIVDDPSGNFFHIICRHMGSDRGQWFSRTKFSRDTLVNILNSRESYKTSLVPISGLKKHDTGAGSNSAGSTATFWSGVLKAEALLAAPGWLVRIEPVNSPSVLKRSGVLIPVMAFCFIGLSYLFLSRQDAACQDDSDSQPDQDRPTALQQSSATPEPTLEPESPELNKLMDYPVVSVSDEPTFSEFENLESFYVKAEEKDSVKTDSDEVPQQDNAVTNSDDDVLPSIVLTGLMPGNLVEMSDSDEGVDLSIVVQEDTPVQIFEPIAPVNQHEDNYLISLQSEPDEIEALFIEDDQDEPELELIGLDEITVVQMDDNCEADFGGVLPDSDNWEVGPQEEIAFSWNEPSEIPIPEVIEISVQGPIELQKKVEIPDELEISWDESDPKAPEKPSERVRLSEFFNW